ncbi:MAG: hypothetical protein AB2A00_01185 [Myxococcota bacterium]
MIEYDVVLEDLPERVAELTVRLRDMMLSLGPGITEAVSGQRLDYSVRSPLGYLAPDRTGVDMGFVGPFDPPLRDPEGRLQVSGRGVVMRLASAADIDDYMRRIARDAFAQVQARAAKAQKGRATTEQDLELDARLEEALKQVSRGLRLMSHHLQVMQKTAEQKAASAARLQGLKRSHKKKPPAVPPPLPVPPPVVAAPVVVEKAARPAPAKARRPAPKARPKPKAVKKPVKKPAKVTTKKKAKAAPKKKGARRKR